MSEKEKYYIGSPNATKPPKNVKKQLAKMIKKYGIPKEMYVDIPGNCNLAIKK